jgi:hypothetical protein
MITEYATFCKALKTLIAAKYPDARTFKKAHVAGYGYVYFIKDASGATIAKTFRNKCKMVIA